MTPALWVTLAVGILGGLIGGISSQLVAGYFKTRGDELQLAASTTQFEQLQQRWREEQEFERQKLLANDRRQLFVTTAHALQRMRELLNQREWAEENNGSEGWYDAMKRRADELFLLETEIRLLAPTLTNTVRAAAQTARKIREAPITATEPEIDRDREDFVRYTMAAMDKMRAILGTKPADASELTPAEQVMLKGVI